VTKELLAKLLKAASEAHHLYEQSLHHADADWYSWYAQYVLEHIPTEIVPDCRPYWDKL